MATPLRSKSLPKKRVKLFQQPTMTKEMGNLTLSLNNHNIKMVSRYPARMRNASKEN